MRSSPARTDQRVKDRVGVIDKALRIAGKQLKTRRRVRHRHQARDRQWQARRTAKGWDDNKIEAAFDAITVTSSAPSNAIADAVRVFARPPAFAGHPSGSNDPRDQAYYDSVRELEGAWREKTPT